MGKSSAPSPIQQQLSAWLQLRGFEHFGFAQLSRPMTFDFYQSWVEQGYHADMGYLSRHLKLKESPQLFREKAQSAIVIAFHYIPHPHPAERTTKTALRVARYARGEDYHDWLKNKLNTLILELKSMFPDEDFLAATDSSPVLERDLAYRAGLGWFGKNTCLIHQRRGSFFLIGEILTSLDFKQPEAGTNSSLNESLPPDLCGTCMRCIEACPTKAILAPRVLDARKCISYWTIEAKSAPPVEMCESFGDHFFGCDICQNVCPWNEKIYKNSIDMEKTVKLKPSLELVEELRFILSSSYSELERQFQNTPLERARGYGLKRNALIVAANHKCRQLTPEIEHLLLDARLGELASWAMASLRD